MLPINPQRIPALYQQALGLRAQGKRLEARELLERLTEVRAVAEVEFQLAGIALEENRPEQALHHLEKAVTLKPREPALWEHLFRVLERTGDVRRTRDWLKKAQGAGLPTPVLARLRRHDGPGRGAQADSSRLQIMQALDRGDGAAALRLIRPMLARNGRDADLHCLRARAQRLTNDRSEAARSYGKALEIEPANPQAIAAQGLWDVAGGRREQGLAELRRALKAAPEQPGIWEDFGIALAHIGDGAGAIRAWRQLLSLRPDQVPVLRRLGDMHNLEKEYSWAETALHRAEELGGADVDLLLLRAVAQDGQHRSDDALQTLDRAVAMAPADPAPLVRKAQLLQVLGRFDEAEACFAAALDKSPHDGAIYRQLVAAHRIASGDPLIAKMEELYDAPALSPGGRVELGFALAKASGDLKRHDDMIAWLRRANSGMRELQPFDLTAYRQELEEQKTAYSGYDEKAAPVPGTSDFAPIFVTGLPRSGTTLVEQILAGHSETLAVGEAGIDARQAQRLLARPGGGLRPITEIPPEDIAAFGHDLAERLSALVPGKGRIIDKSIQTYRHMGLIRRALPNARILVVRRDPRDTLFSIYRNIFAAGTHRYAYDLEDLAAVYVLFHRTIGFWRHRAPGAFHEVQYETLVREPEVHARELVAAAGLDWQESCLDVSAGERHVATLSVYQARQPIYASSVSGWRRHADALKPMIDVLEREGVLPDGAE